MSDFQVKVKSVLDTSGIEKQLAEIQKKAKLEFNIGGTKDADLGKFSESAKKGAKSIDDLSGSTKNLNDNLDKTTKSSQKVANATKKTGEETKKTAKETMTYGQRIKEALSALSQWAIATALIYAPLRKIQEGVQFVYDFDNQMASIQMVTAGTAEETDKLAQSYTVLADKISSTTSNVAEAAEEWLRQGRSIADTNTLIETSQIFAKISGIDNAESVKLLTSAINGYQLSAKEAISVVDKLSAVDVNAATSAQDLATAMAQTASSAQLSGVTMDELLSYIATVADVTQKSAESIGNSYKTIFARLQQVKLGSLTDQEGQDISNVDTVLKEYGITLRDAAGQFRDVSDILNDLNEKFKTLDSTQKSEIATTIAGVRQRENFLVLLQNYDKALKLQTVSSESAGSSMKKFQIYEESAQAATERLTNAFQKLFLGVDSGILKTFINGITAILNFANSIGGLRTILIAVGAILATWKADAIVGFFMGLPKLINGAVVSLKLFTATASAAELSFGVIGIALAAASIAWGIYQQHQEEVLQKNQELEDSFDSQKDTLQTLADRITQLSSGTVSESDQRTELLSILKELNAEYYDEAQNIKDITKLREYAIGKIQEESKAEADAFMKKYSVQYKKAKSYMETPTKSGALIDFYKQKTGTPEEIMRSYEADINKLYDMKESGVVIDEDKLKNLEDDYAKFSKTYNEYVDIYDRGNAAIKIQNDGIIKNADILATVDTAQKDLTASTEAYTSEIQSAISSTNTLITELEGLKSTIEKVNAGQVLSGSEISNLLDKYPELYDNIITLADGYSIESSALQEIINKKINDQQQTINDAKNTTQILLEAAGIKVDIYNTEISKIQELINAKLQLIKANGQVFLSDVARHDPDMKGKAISSYNEYMKQNADEIAALEEALKQTTNLGVAQTKLKLLQQKNYTAVGTSAEEAKKKADEAEKARQEAIAKEIEIRMNAIEAEKKAVEDAYDAEIEKLKEVNEERQDEIDLINAKEALLNAQTQKTKRVYYEGQGWVWEQDKQAIKDATEALAELTANAKIKAKEEEKTAAVAKVEAKQTAYEKSLLDRLIASKDAGTKETIGNALGLTELNGGWYNGEGKRVYKEGGIAGFTGLAKLDGTPSKPEMITNSKQTSALFGFIKSLTNPESSRKILQATAGNTTYSFGNLSFPNVYNVKDFLRELELLKKNR